MTVDYSNTHTPSHTQDRESTLVVHHDLGWLWRGAGVYFLIWLIRFTSMFVLPFITHAHPTTTPPHHHQNTLNGHPDLENWLVGGDMRVAFP